MDGDGTRVTSDTSVLAGAVLATVPTLGYELLDHVQYYVCTAGDAGFACAFPPGAPWDDPLTVGGTMVTLGLWLLVWDRRHSTTD
ncbi:MAG: hypothetical protein ABEI99_04620 [Halobaculum sp.]